MSVKPNKCQLSEADIKEYELEKKRKKIWLNTLEIIFTSIVLI